VGSDLFYRFDSLRRLLANHDTTMSRENRDYISFEALGTAILHTQPWEKVRRLVPQDAHPGAPVRSVVLVDEIDKAPRDFPNDILNEIDQEMFFRIPELQLPNGGGIVRVEADPKFKPIVVLTSNSEKNLPAAFLRRCVFHHIEFPDRRLRQRLTDIITANLTQCPPGRLTEEAIDFFYVLREDPTVDKAPATAELVQWVQYLHGMKSKAGKNAPHEQSLKDLPRDDFLGTLGVLAKNVDDLRSAQQHAARLF
jgi:MoxR-like ATPase